MPLCVQGPQHSARRAAQITLVDKGDRFVFKPLLYELLTGEMEVDEVAPRFAELLQDSGIRCERRSMCTHSNSV